MHEYRLTIKTSTCNETPSIRLGVSKSSRINSAVPKRSDSVVRPNYYWTWQLLSDGYHVGDCQQIRSIAYETVLDHLCLAAENGLNVELGWVLSETQVQQLEDVHGTPLVTGNRYSNKQHEFFDRIRDTRMKRP